LSTIGNVNTGNTNSAAVLTASLQKELSVLAQEDAALAEMIRGFEKLLKKLTRISTSLPADSRIQQKAFVQQSIKASNPATEALHSLSPLRTLHRACRIALMETAEPVTAHEIYSRIVRRGSFAFDQSENAIAEIDRVLSLMRKTGEAELTTTIPPRWIRKEKV
jgi:hypothetical protein